MPGTPSILTRELSFAKHPMHSCLFRNKAVVDKARTLSFEDVTIFSSERLVLVPDSDPVSWAKASTDPALTSETQVHTVEFISLHLPSSAQSRVLLFPHYILVNILTNRTLFWRLPSLWRQNSRTQGSTYLRCLVIFLGLHNREAKRSQGQLLPGVTRAPTQSHMLYIHLSILINRGTFGGSFYCDCVIVLSGKSTRRKCVLLVLYPTVECWFSSHKIYKVSWLLYEAEFPPEQFPFF